MKCIFISVMILVGVSELGAQKILRPTFYSDDYKFQAWFPEEPTKESATVETLYGSSKGDRWFVKTPEVTLRVSVTRFSAAPVEAEDKQLNVFYRRVCPQLTGASWSPTGNNMFGEIGASCGARLTKQEAISLHIFLVRDLLYIASAQWVDGKSSDPTNKAKVDEFLETFLFFYLDKKEEKMVWGLPPELSQVTARKSKADAPR